jgi:hypothetical protein
MKEVAISQIFPLNLSVAKVKKLNEWKFYLKIFEKIFGYWNLLTIYLPHQSSKILLKCYQERPRD